MVWEWFSLAGYGNSVSTGAVDGGTSRQVLE